MAHNKQGKLCLTFRLLLIECIPNGEQTERALFHVPRGQIHINLPPVHPIMSSETIEIKMAAVSAKKVCCLTYMLDYIVMQMRKTNREKNEGIVSKETVVLRRWRSSIQKFGFINGVDNVNWPPYRDSKS